MDPDMDHSRATQIAQKLLGAVGYAAFDPSRGHDPYTIGRERWGFYSVIGTGGSWREAIAETVKFLGLGDYNEPLERTKPPTYPR